MRAVPSTALPATASSTAAAAAAATATAASSPPPPPAASVSAAARALALLLLQHPRAALLGRAAAWYACWLLLQAVAKQPCVSFLLQYWSLQSPRRLLAAGPLSSAQAARARKQLQLLLFAFI